MLPEKREYQDCPRLLFCDPNDCWMPFVGDFRKQLQARAILSSASWDPEGSTKLITAHSYCNFAGFRHLWDWNFSGFRYLWNEKTNLAPFPQECQSLFTGYTLQVACQERLKKFSPSFSISACESYFGWAHSCSSLYVCICVMMKAIAPQDSLPPRKSYLGWCLFEVPIEHLAVICRMLQELCIMGTSNSHNITLPAQCIPSREIMRPVSVQEGTRLSAVSS